MEDILLTVQEWLGEDNKLGIDIWKRKYRYNNETFDEWLDRVSGGNENLRNLIKEKKFMFGGRITANRNTNKKASMMNCFVAGTKVITKRGLINIENVVIGDEVITEDNTWQTVNNIMSHEYDGDLYKIDAVGLYNSIICSPNHKFLTQNGWKRADRLLAGEHSGRINSPDKLKIPCFNYSYNKSEIDFSQHFKSEKKRIVNIGDNRIIVETCEKNHGTECWKKHGYSIPHTIIPDDDFFYFIGRWLGDGSITRVKGKKSTQPSILQIVFNKTTEENDALYIASIGEKYFGFKPTITYTKQNVIAVRFCNEIVGSWFLGEFGQKCDGKFVPKKYFGNFPMALGLLDSDGCISTHGNFKIVLKNKNLISWLRDSLFLNGYPTQPIYDVKRQKNTYMFSISSYIINQRLMQHMKKKSWDFKNGNSPSESYLYRDYINITSINILENQKCKLFNLSVENNHTYTANGVVVHNCYSRGFIQDSLDDIMQANTDIALTFKTQGGQGLSLSKIRPKGCGINHGQFKSDGIIPFMELYNRTTESISQGGSRKGALLIGLDIWHKEAEDFIKIKSEEGRIQKANLSLEIDDEFMECVKKYYETGEIITKHIKKDYNGNIVEYDVVPVNLYKLMMSKAYDWAEPGCIFTNKFRNYNLMEYCPDYTIEICNPCGEQPLGKNSACDLGSINLSEFVIYPFSSNAQFEFDKFERAIDIGVRALDEIIDENQDNHALEEQKEMSLNYRNIGLGTMGMWDMLCKLNMKYGSDESKEFVNDLFRFMFRSAVISSSNLAREKGTFPRYSPNVLESSIIKEHFTDSELKLFDIDEYGLRNCSLLSIAPTGSIGTMLNISTGCEPAFQISYKRKTESLNSKDTYYDVYIQLAKDYMKKNNTKSLPSTFVSAADIDWKDRIDMQSILQKHVDTAISSTINLSKDISGKEIEELYLYAWEKGVKGVTIFRDGCARTGILSTDSKNENGTKESYSVDDLPRGTVIKADDNCIGRKRTLQTGCGTLHCEAFFDPDDGNLLETYFSKGSSGGCGQFMVGLSRMISLAARGGVDIYSIVDQLKSSGTCPSYAVRNAIKHDTSKGSSCPVAIGNALVDMYEEVIDEIYGGDDDTENEEIKCNEISNIKHAKCPQCGGNLVFEGGCNTCKDCGWSKCD